MSLYVSPRFSSHLADLCIMSDPLLCYLDHHGLSLDHCPSDPTKFRAVHARRHFSRGSTVITSQPLAAIPLPQTKSDYCNRCFKPDRLQRCSKCKVDLFCGKECFTEAWKEWHRYTCRIPTKTNSKPVPDDNDNDDLGLSNTIYGDGKLDEEMLVRVALALAVQRKVLAPPQKGPAAQQTDPSVETPVVTLSAFSTLMSHADLHPPSTIARYKTLARGAILNPVFNAIPDCDLSMLDLTTYLCRFRCNNFAVHDAQLFAIGEGTYPVGSLFNHSCRPNAVVAYKGATQVLRCIEDVEPGEEVVIGYVDPANGRAARRQKLREKYFFTCVCERCCEGEAGGVAFLDEMLGEAQTELERAQEMMNGTPSATQKWIEAEIRRWKQEQNKYDALTPQQILASSNPLTLPAFASLVLNTLVPAIYQTSITDSTPTPKTTYNDLLTALLAHLHARPAPKHVSRNPTMLRTLVTATRLFYDRIAEDAWDEAGRLGMYVLAVYLLMYPRYHPMVGLHTLTLAKCLWNGVVKGPTETDGARARECERWVGVAKWVVAVGFGEGSQVARELEELAGVVQRDGM
ncbi:hypothetical protein BC936DRAFT_138128 [Jimgerdemannia flammicorona]|uniref:SET domain-containing protein n=1 Tax=Jimgerdemannia flammicorona TaxID=994334 RepID=A0A433DIK7_9FUNG|nr:hypothetical protein BC936DRAFT_138128 [Jimgerdemannia flammicorona]